MQNASSPPSRYTWDHDCIGGSSCDPASIGNVTTVIKRRSLNSIIIIPRFSTPLLLLRSLSLSPSPRFFFHPVACTAIVIRAAA